MHEYEFRLVVTASKPFTSLFKDLGYSPKKCNVTYFNPHFRFKNNVLDTKRIESIESVYHDDLWFKWVHSIETPYRCWSRPVLEDFIHRVGDYQDPFTVERRDFVKIDENAQLYAFKKGSNYNLVFEWEYGTFKKPLGKSFNGKDLLRCLNKYKRVYDAMRCYSLPPYELNEKPFRKSVTCVSKIVRGKQYLYAHKLDGVFGLVYSYRDGIKEKWEGYECVEHRNVTLGDGFVFAAEKIESGQVVLLDVYQVRGHDTASWCRREILLKFLPRVRLIENYFVQTYFTERLDSSSPPPLPFKTDGIIIHDTERDVVFKYKTKHSVDLVYFKGYFQLPNGRIKSLEEEGDLEDGCVYEISIDDGKVLRKRTDRFKGNSTEQIDNVFSYGWNGPPIEYKSQH